MTGVLVFDGIFGQRLGQISGLALSLASGDSWITGVDHLLDRVDDKDPPQFVGCLGDAFDEVVEVVEVEVDDNVVGDVDKNSDANKFR